MRVLFAILFAVLLLDYPCQAVDVQQEIYDSLNLDELEKAVPNELDDMMSGFDIFHGEGIDDVFAYLKDLLSTSFQEQAALIWKPAVHTLLITVICSMMLSVLHGDEHRFPITMAGGAGIVFLTLSDTQSFFQNCVVTVQRLYDFSTVLMPCLAGVSIFTGAGFSAGVKYTAAALVMNILLNFCSNFLVPLITIYLLCVIGHTVFQHRILGSISDFIRWGCITILTGSVVLFTTYLSVAGLIASAGDTLTTRLTKSALSTGLPIVGSIISDTASTLVAGASVLRNGIGLFGVFVVLGILVIPFVSMGVRYIAFKAIGKLSELFPNHRFSDLIRGIAGAYGMMMAVMGTGFVMIFLTIVSLMNLIGGG